MRAVAGLSWISVPTGSLTRTIADEFALRVDTHKRVFGFRPMLRLKQEAVCSTATSLRSR